MPEKAWPSFWTGMPIHCARQRAITPAWSADHPTVGLSFDSNWGGGYSSDPSGMDVFVFDAIFLDYSRAQASSSRERAAKIGWYR